MCRKVMMLLVWVYLTLCPTAIFCQQSWYTDFINVTSRIHKETCGLSSDLTVDTGSFENKCCGNCYIYEECEDHEKCCLSRFLSSRTNCVLPQFLTSKEETNYPNAPDVESYWMETSCPKETIGFLPMDGLQDLCENPGNYNFLEAHLPVSEADKSVHYRNVFCAFCWNVSPMQLKTWRLEVHCHKQLDVTDRNILLETRNEKCNIFFKPTYYYDQHMCTFHQYTIYQCNQSGLWKDKDEMLEWACDKYYDPFNTTYKNYFCYLCNVDDTNPPNNWHCPDALPSTITKRAPHIARFELTAWRNALYKELMCDEMTEFTDYKMGVCRLIHCDSGKVRSGNYCRHRRGLRAKYCPSFFVKMTIISVLQDIFASKLNDSIGLIRKTIRVNLLPIDITNVKLFVKSERASNDRPVDYFVAKFILEQNYVHGIYLSLILSNLHRKILTFYLNETYAFLCELAFFDEMIDGSGETYIKVQSYRQTSLDKLTILGSKDYVELDLCRETPIVQLHKTNLRPYIKLNIKELPMAFIDGTLILYGRHLTISLSKFEHKVQDDMVYICLEDYLLLYNAESGQTKQSSALLEQSRLSITLSLITVAFVYLFIPGFSSSSTSDKYRSVEDY